MTDEKAALVVDQQFVELGRDRARDAEPFCGPRNDLRQCPRPVLAADGDAPSLDLPGAAHLRIDDRVGAATIGGARGGLDQLLGLSWQERQCNRADALDFDARRQQFGATTCKVVAGPVDFAENVRKPLGDRHEASAPLPLAAFSAPSIGCEQPKRMIHFNDWASCLDRQAPQPPFQFHTPDFDTRLAASVPCGQAW